MTLSAAARRPHPPAELIASPAAISSAGLSIQNTTGRSALQRHVSHDLSRKLSNRNYSVGSQSVTSLPCPSAPSSQTQSVMEEAVKYRNNSPKSLGKRISDALWHRVNARALTRDDLRRGLGCSASTVDNLMSGNHDPSGPVLMALLAFADDALANEILQPTGCVLIKLCDRRAAAFQQIAEGMKALKALDGG